MPPETESVDAAVQIAQAEIVDATARRAQEAETAAAAAVASAAISAAAAEDAAQQRVEEIAAVTVGAVQNQEEHIAWLRQHAETTNSRLTAAETQSTDRFQALETALTTIAATLAAMTQPSTPQVSGEVPAAESPAEVQSSAVAGGQKEPQKQKPPRNRWI